MPEEKIFCMMRFVRKINFTLHYNNQVPQTAGKGD